MSEIVPVPLPGVGEEFELTYDFTTPDADPLQMVYRLEGTDPSRWEFRMPTISGLQRKVFVLLDLGQTLPNHPSIFQSLSRRGHIAAEGQWALPFREKYGHNVYRGHFLFPRHVWTDNRLAASVPWIWGHELPWHMAFADPYVVPGTRVVAYAKWETPAS